MPEEVEYAFARRHVHTTHAFDTLDGRCYAYNPKIEQLFIRSKGHEAFKELMLHTSRKRCGIGGTIWESPDASRDKFKLTDSDPPQFLVDSKFEPVEIAEIHARIIADCLSYESELSQPYATETGKVVTMLKPVPWWISNYYAKIFVGKVGMYDLVLSEKSGIHWDAILSRDIVLYGGRVKLYQSTRGHTATYESESGALVRRLDRRSWPTLLWNGEPLIPINFVNATVELNGDQIDIEVNKTKSV